LIYSESEKEIDFFKKTFNCQRTDNNDGISNYGLSIVIPYPKAEITINKIAKAILNQYFYAIITGQLIIVLESPGRDFVEIDSQNIETNIDKLEWDSYDKEQKLRKSLILAKASLKIKEEEFLHLIPPDIYNVPMWKLDWLIDDHLRNRITASIEKFENGEIIPFKIPLKVHIQDTKPEIRWFEAFVQYDGNLNETDSYFIRDGINISGNKVSNKKGLRILIVLKDKKLARMFGDSENPAHTEFQRDSPNFINKYEHGSESISFLINTPENLYNLLQRTPEGIDDEILKDIFFIELEEEPDTQKQKKEKSRGDEDDDKEPIEIISHKLPFKITKLNGGFQVSNNPKCDDVRDYMTINVAYHVMRGNPLKRYSSLDFDLSTDPIIIDSEGIEIERNSGNTLICRIIDSSFKVKVTGFDPERDLFIKAD